MAPARPTTTPKNSAIKRSIRGRSGTWRFAPPQFSKNRCPWPTNVHARRISCESVPTTACRRGLYRCSIVTCVAVGALFIIYFTRKLIVTQFAVPVTPIASGGGGTGGKGGALGGGDLEPPNAEDAAAVEESQMQDTLSAVTSAVASRTAVLTDESIDVDETTQAKGDGRTPGSGGGRGGGAGGGIGSGFGPGHGGTEPRREIRFEPATLLEYAQWLDFFKIELGVLGQDNKVYYAYNLSHDKPDVRVGDPAQETRLYMNPTDSQFAALDRQLAEKAGIADKGQIILQFYPTRGAGDFNQFGTEASRDAQARDHSQHGLSRYPLGKQISNSASPIKRIGSARSSHSTRRADCEGSTTATRRGSYDRILAQFEVHPAKSERS